MKSSRGRSGVTKAAKALRVRGPKLLLRRRRLGNGSEANGEKTSFAALKHMHRADDMAAGRKRPLLVRRLHGGREAVDGAAEGRGSHRAVHRYALVEEWDVDDGWSHDFGSPPNVWHQRRA